MIRDYRTDFPMLRNRLENGKPLVYLDNAATSLKPGKVIQTVEYFFGNSVANPHRGAYALSAEITEHCEEARKKTADFIHAASTQEIIFTRNTTDSINLLALSYGEQQVGQGDEILISIAEHHSNLLPWQRLAKKKGAVLRYVYLEDDGSVSLDEMEEKITNRTKIVAVNQISNVLGIENPVAQIAELVHQSGAVLVVDGAQSVPHIPVDVQKLDIDFLTFSAHKMLGPDGIGVLYGKKELLEQIEPVMLGGGIVEEVTQQEVRLLDLPARLEPGTPNVEGILGLAAAIDYINSAGFSKIRRIERELTDYALEEMQKIYGVEIYGSRSAKHKNGILAFNIADVHPHDVASVLDAYGVTIRAGHHCAQPLMNYLGIHSCCRMSFYLYNTRKDVDVFIQALSKVRGWLGYEPERIVHYSH